MLEIKNVNLNVGNTALLSNINLTLEQGKIYGVLGPNGAGKTTLFKSMLGLTAFSGEILSDGQPVSSRCFGSLIEYPAFYPRLTVEENLKLHAQYLVLKRPNIEAALKQVNPDSYTHLRAHETDSDLVCRILLEKEKAR